MLAVGLGIDNKCNVYLLADSPSLPFTGEASRIAYTEASDMRVHLLRLRKHFILTMSSVYAAKVMVLLNVF